MDNICLFHEVMVIDDNATDRLLATAVLKRYAFAEEVVDFSSVFAGLTWLQSLKRQGRPFPPIILLDLNLPIMDGFDFLEHFMAFPEHLQLQTSVIILSASVSPEEIIRVHTYPCVKRFFKKPLSAEKLAGIQRVVDLKIA